MPATVPPDAVPAAPAPAGRSVVSRLWDVFRREPMLLVTCSYLFVSVVGLWDSYWFYRRFEVPILEYMQSGDYFVAGLRRPVYLVLLGWTLVVSYAALWPERWRLRQPERAARMDRRVWFRALFPKRDDWWAYFGLHPETMATLAAVVTMAIVLFSTSNSRAARIERGEGHAIAVQLVGAQGELPGEWRMLGTSNAFVFLWAPHEQRVEVVPVEALLAIRPQASPAQAPTQAPPAATGTDSVDAAQPPATERTP